MWRVFDRLCLPPFFVRRFFLPFLEGRGAAGGAAEEEAVAFTIRKVRTRAQRLLL